MDPPPPSARGLVQVQPVPASTTQRATLVASPSASSTDTPGGARGLLPALEQLQRISQGGHHHQRNASTGSSSALPPLSSRGTFPVETDGVTPGPSAPPHQHLYQRLSGLPPHPASAVVTSRPPAHPSSTVTSVSSISQPSLPTYRQANSYPGDSGDSRPPASPPGVLPSSPAMDPSLPDLLHSHMVPPQVPPARPNQHRHQRRAAGGSRGASGEGGGGNGARRHHRRSQQHQHQGQGGSRQRRRSRTMSGGSTTTATAGEGGVCKEPCVRCVVTVTSFRWVLIVLSVLGVFCVVTGVVLAALRAAGNSFLFLAIMFIGLGILLVIVVVVGWKCTPRGHEPLHALFGIGNFRHGRSSGQTRERRRRRHRNRDGNWYGGVLYPEFQYRRPPPSYAASMQEHQRQQLQQGSGDADRWSGQPPTSSGENHSLPNSPPPSYRSRASTAHSGIHIAFPAASSANTGNQDGELPVSRPPTYRSRAPSRRPSLPRNDMSGNDDGGRDVDFGGQSSAGATVGSDSYEQSSSSQERRLGEEATAASAHGQTFASSATLSTSQSATASPSSTSPHSPGSVTLQVYTLPTVRADNQNPSLPSNSQVQASSSGARNHPSSMAPGISTTTLSSPPPSSSSQATAGSVPTSSVPLARLPSLHQRMESGDRRMLEDALQSLEEHINENEGSARDGGIINLAASFDLEESPQDFNTHL